MTVYTLGVWRVRPGHEDAFVAAWRGLADRTKADFPAASAVLLRDRQVPGMFISSGPWESEKQVSQWRASPAFIESLTELREHLESFEPHSMDLALRID